MSSVLAAGTRVLFTPLHRQRPRSGSIEKPVDSEPGAYWVKSEGENYVVAEEQIREVITRG